ncbi:PhoX family protein [Chitinimonas koreensis]|uniref:PhoX family protein n=1 Tax=Chitinimonas koreensis TaxID=356302 RepID=UPI00041AD594|nr:PhoX family phosphatase [Chitinimonas koreensis]QNM97328.1 PhoX family phosphatase [Chitinimonas koreensis]
MSHFTKQDELVSNDSLNPSLSQLIDASVSRRQVLAGGAALSASGLFAGLLSSPAAAATVPAAPKATALGFQSVPFSTADKVVVPEGYLAEVLYAWGDPIGAKGKQPAFAKDASNSAEEQALQAGMHHDGMRFFPLPLGSSASKHGLLAINHEYVDPGLLTTDGNKTMTEEKYRKALAAVGVSVVEVAKQKDGSWQVVRPSKYARRITAATPIALSGPAAGHDLLKTEADPTGREVLGTLQNCSNGWTPWGTYLTCEENFDTLFCDFSQKSDHDFNKTRYGVADEEKLYKWNEIDARWDRQLSRNEINRFGWVVEIDPYEPNAKPVKRTALGRVKHEGATPSVAKDGRVVIYMGDDQRFEYIYKFVSSKPWNPTNRRANRDLLDHGTLYVARFNDDGSGEWRELTHGKNGLTAEAGFANQAELLIKTRLAADLVGATKMDRPEWITVNPANAGELYCTLTNNSQRGAEGKPGPDAANPRKNNLFGHIIRWNEAGDDPAALAFKWDIFALAGRPDAAAEEHKPGKYAGDAFGSADGLYYAPTGVLWIQTDISTSTVNQKEYAGMGNNMMLASIPATGEIRRFLTGPSGCEITGISFTPDQKTMFINIQHPGEPSNEVNDPAKPTAVSSWPDADPAGRPRSATVVIRKQDGGVIGV